MLGKNRNMMSSTTHQLSFSTNPLTVLLTPPNISPIGNAGIENGLGDADLVGKIDGNKLRNGETTGVGAGGNAG